MTSESITRTLARLGSVAKSLLGGPQLRKLYEGLSGEFQRIEEYRDMVRDAIHPTESMPAAPLDDLEYKYGITYLQNLSDDARIARIIERITIDGAGGPAWLQATIQAAGFPLYVLENTPSLVAAFSAFVAPEADHAFQADEAGEVWTPPAGSYLFFWNSAEIGEGATATDLQIEAQAASTFFLGRAPLGGLVVTDGASIRIRNTAAASRWLLWHKLA